MNILEVKVHRVTYNDGTRNNMRKKEVVTIGVCTTAPDPLSPNRQYSSFLRLTAGTAPPPMSLTVFSRENGGGVDSST